jgi:hypothetical protein
MKVVCISKSTSLQYELTYGKVYQCVSVPNFTQDGYFIVCDRGSISYHKKRNFITLEEWRENQLNNLLSI